MFSSWLEIWVNFPFRVVAYFSFVTEKHVNGKIVIDMLLLYCTRGDTKIWGENKEAKKHE